MTIDLRHGRWQDVLPDVECDALITDPPYSERTHSGHNSGVRHSAGRDKYDRTKLSYSSWGPDDVIEFVSSWAPRVRGWFCVMTSHDLISMWTAALNPHRYVFAPVPIIQHRVRLSGDGPASSAVYLIVARPRTREYSTWGALPGWYKAPVVRDGSIGSKPVDLMRAIVRHYSRRGDVVCDPCAGWGSTLLAAAIEGRVAGGAEVNEETWRSAQERIARGWTPAFAGFDESTGDQVELFGSAT